MCLYPSLVERKVAEFCLSVMKVLFGLVKMDYFHHFLEGIAGVLGLGSLGID